MHRRSSIPFIFVALLAFAQAGISETTGLTPEQSVGTLKAGNERFVSGRPTYPNLSLARRNEVAGGQHPFAAILSCADSRVSPELLFDAGLGELFVVRVAGNVADNDEIASLEYAVEHLHVPVITVLGHSSCGAVNAVVSGAEVHGSLPGLVDNIIPAVRDARAMGGKKSDGELLASAVEYNVFQSMADLLMHSEIIREHIAQGKTRLIGGVYALQSGAVNWLGPHPEEATLMVRHEESTSAPAERKVHIGHAQHENAHGGDHHAASAFGSQHPDGVSGRAALAKLIEGNLRFADDPETSVARPNRSKERRTELAKGQKPWASVLTCADSRLSPEHLFDAGLGDLFVVRVAGNVADVDEIGSLEYAVGHLKTPLIVVLGHTACGAVTAACSGGELPGHLPGLLDNIEPAVERASHRTAGHNDQLVPLAIRENVFQSISDLLQQSPEILAYVQAGAVSIVGGVYHLGNGRIEWLGEHPDQTQLVASLLVDKQLGVAFEEVTAPGSIPSSAKHQSNSSEKATGQPEKVEAVKPAADDHAKDSHNKGQDGGHHDSGHGAEKAAPKPHH